jgi:hypothetical protein
MCMDDAAKLIHIWVLSFPKHHLLIQHPIYSKKAIAYHRISGNGTNNHFPGLNVIPNLEISPIKRVLK